MSASHVLSLDLLRWASARQGYRLIAHRHGGFDLRDNERRYLKNAPRELVCRFLLEGDSGREVRP